MHWLSFIIYEDDIVNVWTVKINLIIVLLAEITNNEASFFQWILLHDTRSNRLLNLVVKFLYRTNTLLATVFITPDRQWGSPET